jgi:propane monooxygenase reductase subunit
MAYRVRLEPVGIEMEVEEGETVLKAAFRQGIALMHGCKEGQCASCKSILVDGDIDLLRYSTFALPDFERDQNYVLLCRCVPYSDLTVELINYDEELLSRAIPVKTFSGTVFAIDKLTRDIRRLVVDIDPSASFRFWAGQYVDLTIPEEGVTRSFSMANPPWETSRLEFLVRVYPGGAFSSRLDGGIRIGDGLEVTGPYGVCCRRDRSEDPMILVGGGSGFAPLWSILQDQCRFGRKRPIYFFYGARARQDLFYLERIAALQQSYPFLEFIPALSEPSADDKWEGETGFIHEVVQRRLGRLTVENQVEAYVCGPEPMINAVVPVLRTKGIDPENIFFDKFVPAAH